MWSFLTLCSVLRRFVHNFALVRSQNQRLKKGVPARFSYDCEKTAINKLNQRTACIKVMLSPWETPHSTIDRDASAYQVGCVLFPKETDETLKSSSYWRSTLKPVRKLYNTTTKSFLALMWATLMSSLYSIETNFYLRSDNQSLRGMLDLEQSNARRTWCRLGLM